MEIEKERVHMSTICWYYILYTLRFIFMIRLLQRLLLEVCLPAGLSHKSTSPTSNKSFRIGFECVCVCVCMCWCEHPCAPDLIHFLCHRTGTGHTHTHTRIRRRARVGEAHMAVLVQDHRRPRVCVPIKSSVHIVRTPTLLTRRVCVCLCVCVCI